MCTKTTGLVLPSNHMYQAMLAVLAYMACDSYIHIGQHREKNTTMSRTFAYCRVSTADMTEARYWKAETPCWRARNGRLHAAIAPLC
jgi:hypothetical protein